MPSSNNVDYHPQSYQNDGIETYKLSIKRYSAVILQSSLR